jgi:hypothetical protein
MLHCIRKQRAGQGESKKNPKRRISRRTGFANAVICGMKIHVIMMSPYAMLHLVHSTIRTCWIFLRSRPKLMA